MAPPAVPVAGITHPDRLLPTLSSFLMLHPALHALQAVMEAENLHPFGPAAM